MHPYILHPNSYLLTSSVSLASSCRPATPAPLPPCDTGARTDSMCRMRSQRYSNRSIYPHIRLYMENL